MKIALMRRVSENISDCEITTISRSPIDPETAKRQHSNYARVLSDLGYQLHMLDADDSLPDSVFVEDTAVVLDEFAVITRPGAASRRKETKAVAEALSYYKDLEFIGDSGTLDGGDVLRIAKTLYVGKSCRSSAVGIGRLRDLVKHHGYRVRAVPVDGCLHLRSAVSRLQDNRILLNPQWVDPKDFEDVEVVTAEPSEPYGANVLSLQEGVVCSTSFPRTIQMLRDQGLQVHTVDISELAKAEGNISCCCIVFPI